MNFIKSITFILLVGFNIIIVTPSKGWWRNTIIYEIYIRSFMDSNGDGIGDLKGVTSKLDHFVEMGVETIWITPFFKSPMVDMGYDVADYMKIDPLFGTMQDFDELMREMKRRGLKLIIELVINHCSDKHRWFRKSIKRIEPYTDYYVWRDPKGFNTDGTPIPPNNWLSIFEGSAWTWVEERKQFYYHKFEVEQPDLNLTNPAVKEEFKKIIKFWYDKGVSGFRLDAARDLIEDPLFRDEPLVDPKMQKPDLKFNDLNHIYTTDLLETYECIHELREISDSCYDSKKDDKIIVPESWANLTFMMMYYGNESYKMTHFPFNFGFISHTSRAFPTPYTLDGVITSWLNAMPPNAVANWVIENHDVYRLGSRLNTEFQDIFMILIMTLPGVACFYYGQEIGMVNTKLRPDPIAIASVRERQFPARHPMQWNTFLNAGFSRRKTPWLSLNSDYWRVNVETQKKDANSFYNLFLTLSKLRKLKTLKYGQFKSYVLSSKTYAFTRRTYNKKDKRILVVVNLDFERDFVDLAEHIPNLPQIGRVLATSLNLRNEAPVSSFYPMKFNLKPLSAMVFAV